MWSISTSPEVALIRRLVTAPFRTVESENVRSEADDSVPANPPRILASVAITAPASTLAGNEYTPLLSHTSSPLFALESASDNVVASLQLAPDEETVASGETRYTAAYAAENNTLAENASPNANFPILIAHFFNAL